VIGIIAVAPALPLHSAGKYVAGAYVVFMALLLVYVSIMASRLSRTERELTELRRDVQEYRQSEPDHDLEQAGPQASLIGETAGRPGGPVGSTSSGGRGRHPAEGSL